MKRLAVSMAASVLAIAAVAAAAPLFGVSTAQFMTLVLRGSFGSDYAISETLIRTIPLLITSLAVLVAFRCGVWNIGGEGQFVVGGVAAMLVVQHAPAGFAGIVAAMIAASVAGGIWGAIPALLKTRRAAPEVLTTILLNFVAIHLLGYAVNGPLRESSGQYPQSDPVPSASWLPVFGNLRVHAGIVIALLIAGALWFFLFRTNAGLRLRAVGGNPTAARWAGVDVDRVIVKSMILSGAIAGLGGCIELLGVTHRLYERFSSGVGYAAIAVALLAQLNPVAAIAAALFFGILGTGAGELQRSAGVSASIATLAQGSVIALLLLIGSFPFERILRYARRARTAE